MNPTVKTALLLALGPAILGALPALLVMALALWSMQFELSDVPGYFVKTLIDIGPIPFVLTYGLTIFFFGIRKLIAYLSR